MRDPHVESLKYSLETAKGFDFADPPPLEGEESDFRYRLEDGVLTTTMKTHFATEDEARSCVAPFLRSWELDVALSRHRTCLTFKFQRSELVDRDPPQPGEPIVVNLGAASAICFVENVNVTVTQSKYPTPPKGFVASVDAEQLWFRYERCINGGEPLLSMAYACLTLLEGIAGGRKEIERKYKVDFAVLSRLGDLTTNKGDPTEARKLGRKASRIALTEAEKSWTLAAVRALIRRKGEYDADPAATLKQITMSDIV